MIRRLWRRATWRWRKVDADVLEGIGAALERAFPPVDEGDEALARLIALMNDVEKLAAEPPGDE